MAAPLDRSSTLEDWREHLEPILAPALRALDIPGLARHNHGYLAYEHDPFGSFVGWELPRYLHHVGKISTFADEKEPILDIGSFIPTLPIMLHRLGYEVILVDNFALYGGVLDPILEVCEDLGLHYIDADVLDPSQFRRLPKSRQVNLLAVVEHLNGSPRTLLESVRELMPEDGRLFFEVPNIASLGKRLRFLRRGTPPGQPFESYFKSIYPFSGHNREYTLDDVRYSMEETGFRVEELYTFNYSSPPPLRRSLARLAWTLSDARTGWGETIWARCSPST